MLKRKENSMNKSDDVGGKSDKRKVKKSETSEDGGKVNKKFICGTLIIKCYY